MKIHPKLVKIILKVAPNAFKGKSKSFKEMNPKEMNPKEILVCFKINIFKLRK